MGLSESGDWVRSFPERQVDALLVDFESEAALSLTPLSSGLMDYTPFSAEDPTLFPLAVDVIASALSWLRGVQGARGASGYVTAVEEAAASAGVGLGAKTKAKAKKQTVAGLAAQQEAMQEVLSSLLDQVQFLVKGQQNQQQGGATPLRPPFEAARPSPSPGPRPGLADPVSQALPMPPPRPKRLADLLGPPPQTRGLRQQVPASQEIAPGITDEELRLDGGETSSDVLAQAMLEQSRALRPW